MADDLVNALSFEDETPSPAEDTLSFDDQGKPPLSDAVANSRAVKADFALQDMSPGADSLKNGIVAGLEPQMRQEHATQVDMKKYQQGLDVVRSVAGKVGRDLIPEEINTVLRTAQGAAEPTDPKTLWEKLYAVHYTKAFLTDDPERNYVFGKAVEKEPAQSIDAMDKGTNTQAWKEIVATKMQDLQTQWDDKSWYGKVGRTVQNVAESLVMLDKWMLHDAVKSAPTSTILPGRNMLEQIQYLYMLPVDKRAQVMNETVDRIFSYDPLTAFKFMKTMMDYSSSDVHLNDILGVVDPLLMFLPFRLNSFGRYKGMTPTSEEMFKRLGYGVGRDMTPDELAMAATGTRNIVREANAARTVQTPRPMTIRELMAAKDGLGVEQPTGFFTPEAMAKFSERLGTTGERPPVSTYTVNGQQFKPTSETVFVNPDELNTKFAATGDNPRRLFRDQEGHLGVSEQVNGRWQTSGARVTYTTEPQAGQVALNLGPSRSSMGSKYYDNYNALGRVEDVQRVGAVAEPRGMSLQEIMRAREGVPWRLMDQSEVQLLRNSMASAIKAYNPIRVADPQALTGAMGNIPAAAGIGAGAQLTRRLSGLDPLGEGSEFSQNIPSILRGEQFYSGASRSLSQSLATQYANDAVHLNTQLLNALINPTRAPRLDKPALDAAIEAAKKKWGNDAYFKSDGLIEIEHIPANNVTNVDAIGFNFGKKDKSLFDTPQQAEHWAKEQYKFHDGDWVVRQQGNKFLITVPRPLDETDPTVFAKMISTKAQETPMGLANMFFGYLRNSEDVLSQFNRATRHIVTHSPQELKAVLIEAAKPIGTLGKKPLRELEEILIENQKTMKPDGVPGVFYRDVAEFEEAFLRRFNKLPSAAQTRAYDTYVRLNEFDGMLRVLGWHRDMSRLGVVNYRWNMAAGGKPTQTDWVVGRPGEINWASPHDEGIYFFDAASQTGQFVRKFTLKDEERGLRKLINDKIDNEGYQVIQLFSPNRRPLASVAETDSVIHYVIAPAVEHKRLKWGQGVDWQPGGHMIYGDQWYIKQPIIRTGDKGLETYFGDATIAAGGMSERQAAALAQKYEKARGLLVAGDDAALDTFLRGNLPYSLSDFKKLFTGAGPGGGLSKDHPIVPTYTGRNAFETNTGLAKEERYRGLREQATHPSNLEASLDKKFLAERGQILSRVAETGTESNPIFKFEDARLVDPFTSLNMALGNAIRSRFFTDYKQSVAAHWVSEFRDVIKGGLQRADQLERNPVFALYHAEIDKASVPLERARAAEEVRQRALMLMGTRTELGASISRIEQTVMNKLYDMGGEKWTDAVTPAMLAAIKDPATYMRAVAFHFKLGFFNPVQYLVQAQTMVHSMAISPTNAPAGWAAWFVSQKLRFTESEEILNYLSKKVPGWTQDEFKEAYTAMKNSGIQRVGGETAWRDDMYDPNIITTTMGRMLDKGTFFFKEGERATRETAWFIAYKEWRKANPDAVLDQRAVGTILNRWQTMTGDMTSAANASWQKGLLTIPTQFLTFNVRMMEQLLPGLSSRLTPAEKFRVISAYSGLYGIPIGLSTVSGFYPAYDDMRKYAINNGIDVHDNWFKLAHEGLISTMASWATGSDYNVAQRLGPGANNLLTEVLKGNKDVLPLLVGPAGGVMADIAKTTVPFIRAAWYGSLGNDNQSYPITMDDFLGFVTQNENISSFNNFGKMLVGLNIGKYVGRNNVYVGDISNMDSIFVGLGFTPQHILDAQLTTAMLKDQKKVKDALGQELATEVTKQVQAAAKGDDALAGTHGLRARTLSVAAGFTPQEYSKWFQLGLKGWESQADKANRRLLTTGAPNTFGLSKTEMGTDRQQRIYDKAQ